MNDLEAQKKKDADLALIREFAGQALMGLMASPIERMSKRTAPDEFAIGSFLIADAMLAEYKKRYGVE